MACGLNDLQEEATEERSYDKKHYEFFIKVPNMGNPSISKWFNHSIKNTGIAGRLDVFTLAMNKSLDQQLGNNHTGCKGHLKGDLDRQGNNISLSYFDSIKNMIGACTPV